MNEFIKLLKQFEIEIDVDIRGKRFQKSSFELIWLEIEFGIEILWMLNWLIGIPGSVRRVEWIYFFLLEEPIIRYEPGGS